MNDSIPPSSPAPTTNSLDTASAMDLKDFMTPMGSPVVKSSKITEQPEPVHDRSEASGAALPGTIPVEKEPCKATLGIPSINLAEETMTSSVNPTGQEDTSIPAEATSSSATAQIAGTYPAATRAMSPTSAAPPEVPPRVSPINDKEAKQEKKQPDDETYADTSKDQPSGKSRRRKQKDIPTGYNEADLPDTTAKLNDDQIRSLFYLPPKVRKRYIGYFGKNGTIHSTVKQLLFQRAADGNLVHPGNILRSNITSWEKKLLGFEYPDRYNTKGEPFRPQDTMQEPVRKRKRATVEDDTVVEAPAPTKLRVVQSDLFVPLGPDPSTTSPAHLGLVPPKNYPTCPPPVNVPPGHPPMGLPMQSPLQMRNPYSHVNPLLLVELPKFDLVQFITKLQVGDFDLLKPEDIAGLTHWIGQQCLKFQSQVALTLCMEVPSNHRYILISLQETLCRISRLCLDCQEECKNADYLENADDREESYLDED